MPLIKNSQERMNLRLKPQIFNGADSNIATISIVTSNKPSITISLGSILDSIDSN
ncbi:MAG TPA: hypothetical protein VJ767_06170 [Nitrososphaeraceae archaeon]|nr:hypothetical protein [Nitrososphaeraceae archaeon]